MVGSDRAAELICGEAELVGWSTAAAGAPDCSVLDFDENMWPKRFDLAAFDGKKDDESLGGVLLNRRGIAR